MNQETIFHIVTEAASNEFGGDVRELLEGVAAAAKGYPAMYDILSIRKENKNNSVEAIFISVDGFEMQIKVNNSYIAEVFLSDGSQTCQFHFKTSEEIINLIIGFLSPYFDANEKARKLLYSLES